MIGLVRGAAAEAIPEWHRSPVGRFQLAEVQANVQRHVVPYRGVSR
ncbi:hypothetical protein LMG28140_05606 [Paraburkholderia metrosideri]|uniref:Uncharacterized protein n=1 Tax=Paraburkholderia metrosideri TaxID=580937 RepID=A0ABM8P325_9BURK|nr:hypothetical protein LMG28140_05606 [Paraburkholderia metrosideri]